MERSRRGVVLALAIAGIGLAVTPLLVRPQAATDRRLTVTELFGRSPAPPSAIEVAAAHARLDVLLQGDGPLPERLHAYAARFLVGRQHLDRAMRAALAACRTETLRHVLLPAGEAVTIRYTADLPWSGFADYEGGARSLLQVNRVTPFTVGQLLTLACHEGYPGHHTLNVLRDREEPPAATAEGVFAEAWATEAAAAAFDARERTALLRGGLMAAAGLADAEVARFVEVEALVDSLRPVISDAVAAYLDRRRPRETVAATLANDALMPGVDAFLAFVDRTGPSVLAYTFGRDLIAEATASPDETTRWQRLLALGVGTDRFPVR